MGKIPILTIGYSHFALPPKSDVAVLLKTLSQAEAVNYTYDGSKKVFFPESPNRHAHEIAVEYVDERQLLPEEPRKSRQDDVPEAVVSPRRLTAAKPLLMEGGSHAAQR